MSVYQENVSLYHHVWHSFSQIQLYSWLHNKQPQQNKDLILAGLILQDHGGQSLYKAGYGGGHWQTQ